MKRRGRKARLMKGRERKRRRKRGGPSETEETDGEINCAAIGGRAAEAVQTRLRRQPPTAN